MVGTVTIGAKDGLAVTEAKRRIEMILDPPTADVGAVYTGRVVNLTKFGAFVNILPGRDGLLHISKLSSLAGGKRVNQVEDVLELGQSLDVKVDDIDPQGKVSLSIAGDASSAAAPSAPRSSAPRESRPPRSESSSSAGPPSDAPRAASFEESFEAQLGNDLGDLGPASQPFSEDDGARRPRNPRRRR